MRSRPYLVRSAGAIAGSRLVGDLSGTLNVLNRSPASSLLPSAASTRAALNLSQLCMEVTAGVAERRALQRNSSWGSIELGSVGCANRSVPDSGYASYEVRDTLWIVVPFSVIYTTIFVVGVLGNVITCVVISRNKSMHTATNYYLFSLAISDLLLLLTGVPQELYFIWYRFPYPFGNGVCIMASFAAETSANATVLTITAFTVERYVAICKPFLSHTMSRLSRAVRFVLGIWLIAMGLAIPQTSH
ncbi:pyrokinin-1 receptor-like [Anopheles bellator]|uniref:pyrokinin-1 receptor-like n=1 Tax=Anopheles bellator TaxID=139047 RepID=UPI002647FA91|nr:pyrokinin-1 receptor-like [Anopheles bellator]